MTRGSRQFVSILSGLLGLGMCMYIFNWLPHAGSPSPSSHSLKLLAHAQQMFSPKNIVEVAVPKKTLVALLSTSSSMASSSSS